MPQIAIKWNVSQNQNRVCDARARVFSLSRAHTHHRCKKVANTQNAAGRVRQWRCRWLREITRRTVLFVFSLAATINAEIHSVCARICRFSLSLSFTIFSLTVSALQWLPHIRRDNRRQRSASAQITQSHCIGVFFFLPSYLFICPRASSALLICDWERERERERMCARARAHTHTQYQFLLLWNPSEIK